MSINYSDSYTDLMLDFSLNYNKNQIVDFTDTTIHHSSNAYKRRIEGINGKNLQAINMINRALNAGIYADYLLVDSWYAKPNFINEVKQNGLDVIARVSKSNKIWQFIGNSKTLESLYNQAKHHKCSKLGNYNSIKYSYVSAIVTHKTLGKIKIVFIKKR